MLKGLLKRPEKKEYTPSFRDSKGKILEFMEKQRYHLSELYPEYRGKETNPEMLRFECVDESFGLETLKVNGTIHFINAYAYEGHVGMAFGIIVRDFLKKRIEERMNPTMVLTKQPIESEKGLLETMKEMVPFAKRKIVQMEGDEYFSSLYLSRD